ncbi:MAG: hypothetical protein IKL89_09260 [Clostridia bacterium]|nr:hypothetical protein [Clostridia bacterium]
MTSALLILLIVFLYSFQTLFCAKYSENYAGKSENSSAVFCVLEGLFMGVFTLCWIGFKFELSPISALLGILNACVLFWYNMSLIKANARGSYAFMNVVLLFGGILLPLLYSTILRGDSLKWYQLCAIGLMLLSFVVMNYREIKLKGAPLSYYVICLILFICNGLYGTLLTVQSDYNVSQKNEMLILTFVIMGGIAFLQLAAKERKDVLKAFRIGKKAVLPLLLCLISASVAANILILIIPMVNTAVLFTVQSGGVLLLSVLYSYLFFKEKATVPGIIGFIMALISITVLSL